MGPTCKGPFFALRARPMWPYLAENCGRIARPDAAAISIATKTGCDVASGRAAAYKGGASECSAARLAHLSGGQGVVGSNPATPTISL